MHVCPDVEPSLVLADEQRTCFGCAASLITAYHVQHGGVLKAVVAACKLLGGAYYLLPSLMLT